MATPNKNCIHPPITQQHTETKKTLNPSEEIQYFCYIRLTEIWGKQWSSSRGWDQTTGTFREPTIYHSLLATDWFVSLCNAHHRLQITELTEALQKHLDLGAAWCRSCPTCTSQADVIVKSDCTSVFKSALEFQFSSLSPLLITPLLTLHTLYSHRLKEAFQKHWWAGIPYSCLSVHLCGKQRVQWETSKQEVGESVPFKVLTRLFSQTSITALNMCQSGFS